MYNIYDTWAKCQLYMTHLLLLIQEYLLSSLDNMLQYFLYFNVYLVVKKQYKKSNSNDKGEKNETTIGICNSAIL